MVSLTFFSIILRLELRAAATAGQEQKSVPAGGGLGQYRLLTGGSKIAPVGPKTESNFRRGRGMNNVLLFGKEGEDVVENSFAIHNFYVMYLLQIRHNFHYCWL